MANLTTRFGRNSFSTKSTTPLEDEQIFRVAPSIYATEKHGSRSERYTYIPTADVLNGLRSEGFFPFFAAQSRCRIEGKEQFTKHMLRFRRDTEIGKSEANEIVLVNSHDGTSSYQLMAGCIRFVCTNSMVTGDIIEDIRVKHRGNIVNDVIEAAYTIVSETDAVTESIDNMKAISLTHPERLALAEASIVARYGDEEPLPIQPEEILTPRRYADRGESLWTAFSVIQEGMIRGGVRGRNKSGSRMTTREVTSIDTNIKLNKGLWILAEAMAKLKQ